jgi:hypothetical protein
MHILHRKYNILRRKHNIKTTTAHQIDHIMSDVISYLSCGKLGDFIFQLSIINENFLNTGKKGILFISTKYETFAYGIEKAYNDTKCMIMKQPYIADYKIHAGEVFDINLSLWRKSRLLYKTHFGNILNDCYGVEWGKHKWITTSNNPIFNGKTLFSCSTVNFRFPQNINFQKLFTQQNIKIEDIIFITQNKQEYDNFVNKTGLRFELYIADSFDDLLSAINGCACYIGNMSSPLTIANALHKRAIALLANCQDRAHALGLETIIPELTSITELH